MTLDPTTHRNLGAVLAEQAVVRPASPAVTFYRGPAADRHETLSFAALVQRARIRAADLADRLPTGARVLICLPTCPEFVEAYLGCLMAGVVAVPTPPPGGSATAVGRIASIARDCTPSLALALSRDVPVLADQLHDVEALSVEAADRPLGADRPLPPAREPDRDTLAVLQYSSGSTGSPRGVMLTHGNVLDNLAAFARDVGFGPDDVFGAWIPLHHDMGLFAQLTVALLNGAHCVLMSPTEFVRRPVEWLRMLTAFGATVTAAPDFAYDMCTRLVSDEHLGTLNLSRLRVLLDGSEPIHVPTVAAFVARFAEAGLRPQALSAAYGMAEVTVYLSVTPTDLEPTVLAVDPRRLEDADHPELRPSTDAAGREIIGVGTLPSFSKLIVDPRTLRPLPDGAIGEIWLQGPGVSSGYWGRPELSEANFRARPAAADDAADAGTAQGGSTAESGPWLRTGDLGAAVAGELFVTGRLKELLILRGRNIFPQDLERAARAAHPALKGFFGAAFSVPVPDERAVLVHEVAPATAAQDLADIAAAVSRGLTAGFGVPVRNILLVRRGTIRRTTSGKIQRAAMREQFLAGRIGALHARLDPEVTPSASDGAS